MEILDPKWIRVSTILSVMPSKNDEGKWYFPIQEIDPDVLRRKADLGEEVHNAIEGHEKGEFHVLSERARPYFNSYLKWRKVVDPQIQESEKRFFYEPMNLSGKIDMLTRFCSGTALHLVDFKCTFAADHKKWALQGAFYHFLAMLNGYDVNTTCYFVQLDADGGNPKVHTYLITKELNQAAISLYNTYIYLTK